MSGPGPWSVDEDGCVMDAQNRQVAGVNPMDRAANAPLIAAAPDMLEALRAAHRRMGDIGCNYGRDDDFTAVCDAIAKAEGRPE